MADIADQTTPEMRRVRPWIAALLTVLGFGVGFYYARSRSAVLWAVAQVALGFAVGGAAVAYLYFSDVVPPFVTEPDGGLWVMLIGWGVTFCVAVAAWAYAARHREVERGNARRLFGYFAIWLGPLVISLITAMCLRFFWLQPFRIPSEAMEPTLQIGDYIIVSKSSYGYGRYPTQTEIL